MNFQKYALLIGTVCLVLVLTWIGYMLYKSKSELVFPPTIAQCPDYWEVTGDNVCNNVKNLGNHSGSMDFSGSGWSGQSGLKKKYCWAKENQVIWDGVTNNNTFTNGTTC